MRGDGEVGEPDEAKEDGREAPRHLHVHVGAGGVGVRLDARLAGQGRERCCLCLLWVEGELALVDCLRVELLGGVVGGRGAPVDGDSSRTSL